MKRDKKLLAEEKSLSSRPSTIEKIINIGLYKNNYCENRLPVFCKIEYKEGKLSISGVVAPTENGDAYEGGQIYDSIAENLDFFDFAEGWDKIKAFQFVEYWKEWHLNDLQAGCEHQRAEKWGDKRIDPKELPNSCANQDKNGILAIWVTPEEHTKGLLGKPCPVCGYEYGTAWLTKEVPTSVLIWLNNLPASDKTPTWI